MLLRNDSHVSQFGLSCCVALLLVGCGGIATLDNTNDAGSAASGGLRAGSYVLSLSFWGEPRTPFMFDAKLDVSSNLMTITLQALAAADRLTPVGQQSTAGPFPVLESGLYTAGLVSTLPAEAVPFFPTEDAELQFQLEAQRPTCGLVSGDLTFVSSIPTDLTGSTYAMLPADHPDARVNPIIDCAGTHAGPL